MDIKAGAEIFPSDFFDNFYFMLQRVAVFLSKLLFDWHG